MRSYAKYAKLSVGAPNDGWRWSVAGSPILPGCVDLTYEELCDDKWKVVSKIESLSVEALTWLANHAKIVVEIEEEEDSELSL